MELALKKGIEDGDIDENLYYQYVRSDDELIPYRTMYKREMQNFEAHDHNMIPLSEWEFQKELAKRALERAVQWSQRAKKEEDVNE